MISYDKFEKSIKNFSDVKVTRNFPTKNFVTFRAGGNADVFVEPNTVEALTRTIQAAKNHGIEYICVGGGSNLLVRDGGFRGIMICVSGINNIKLCQNRIFAGCGARLSSVVSFSLANSLRGMEFCGGIPGTVGGGVFMNAGAYGGEIKDVILSADVMDKNGQITTYDREMLGLSYRHSAIMENDGIITSAVFELINGDENEGREILKELNRKRREKQPVDMPSAGSTFKRPQGYFAAALIENAGLKGLSIGGAQVSKKHAGFVINTGGASAKNIEDLTELIKKRVYISSGVELSLEIKIVGEEL